MTPKSSYVLVGLFVLILGVALIGGILWLSTGGPPKDYEFYLIYMPESVSGLSLDAPVKYKGVNVGRVRDIRLNPDNPEEVRLLLVVLQGTPVNAETTATLEVQGLTGVANINLSGGGPDSPALQKPDNEPYPVIQSRPSLLVRLDDTVSELLGNLIETSARLNALLDQQNRAAISGTLDNMQTMTANFANQSGRVDEILTELSATLGNTRSATERLPALLDQLERSAAAFETMAQALAETGEVLQVAGVDLKETIEVSGEDLRVFTGDTLPAAGTLVSELRMTARNLRRMSESLQRDPSVLLFGPPKPQPGPGEQMIGIRSGSLAVAVALLLSACAILPGGKKAVNSSVYLLETRVPVVAGDRSCEVIVVIPPESAPGHIGAQMLYQRKPNQIERFAFSRWAASPAIMIEPLLLDALRAGDRYGAVLPSPAPVRADLRIENDSLWLIQRFEGERSFIELRMSSRIYAPALRRLIASQDFSYKQPANAATPAAGVVAADQAVQRLLQDYIAFVASAASGLGHSCGTGH